MSDLEITIILTLLSLVSIIFSVFLYSRIAEFDDEFEREFDQWDQHKINKVK